MPLTILCFSDTEPFVRCARPAILSEVSSAIMANQITSLFAIEFSRLH
jgi:hypothetical protein